MPTEEEIEAQITATLDRLQKDPTDAYARGVREALGWVSGENDEPPIEVEE